MKIILSLLLLSLLSSCETPKNSYRVLLGARSETYLETLSVAREKTLQSYLGGTVTMSKGSSTQTNSAINGVQIGIVEEIPNGITTTLSLFYNSYAPVEYIYNTSSEGLVFQTIAAPTSTGLDATLGYTFLKGSFRIRPGISYKVESQLFDAKVTGSTLAQFALSSGRRQLFVWGGGLAFEYAASKEDRIVLQADYRVPSKSIQGISDLSFTTIQISYLYGDLKF